MAWFYAYSYNVKQIKRLLKQNTILYTANPYFAMQLVNRRCFAMLQIGLVRIMPCTILSIILL
jgi:hypothetical protein